MELDTKFYSEDELMIIQEAESITGMNYIEWTDGDKFEGFVKEDYLTIISDLINTIKLADNLIDKLTFGDKNE